MEWRDEGIVIGLKRHGETSAIIETLTRAHGRHLGLVRGGRGARFQGLLQPGNSLGLVWRRAGRFIASGLALAGVTYLGALLRLLPERDPHEALHEALEIVADHLDMADVAPALLARFEMQVLAECGFRLDLESCAASGARDDLIYVSPKSGRAVSAAAGAPWRDRLLALPAFLRADKDSGAAPDRGEIADAFRLTGFFLERNLFGARGLPMPDSRRAFLAAAMK